MLATMNPHRATPLVFAYRETWLRGPDHVASYEFYSVALLQRAGAGAS